MKNNWLLLLVFGLFFFVAKDASAQTHRRSTGKHRTTTPKKKSKESSNSDFWREQVWYGGNVQLGFSGGNTYSQFIIGLTPMMGFKIKDTPFSVGPRIGYTYVSLKGLGSDGQNHRVSLPSYTTSAFTRLKFLQQFFLHAEYELEWKKQAFIDSRSLLVVDRDGSVLTDKVQRDNLYVGAGYNSGGYEIMVLYNFNVPENSLEQPFSFRGGFTWNF
ncbi:MAG TPA: hypothetical protein ENK85_03985 [Saprospiraceae bacterium]|nr:hypothetical protein [Saprospiraceae bacterium]